MWQERRYQKEAEEEEKRKCVCVFIFVWDGNIADKWSRFSPVTCLSNQQKGFMVRRMRGYNEKLHWEQRYLGINLATRGSLHLKI